MALKGLNHISSLSAGNYLLQSSLDVLPISYLDIKQWSVISNLGAIGGLNQTMANLLDNDGAKSSRTKMRHQLKPKEKTVHVSGACICQADSMLAALKVGTQIQSKRPAQP